MEAILNGLLVPSSDAIKTASAQLKDSFKQDPTKTVAELCQIMASSQTPQVIITTYGSHKNLKFLQSAVQTNCITSISSTQIRQYAAVLVRKRFTKSKNWNKGMGVADRAQIKAGCLQALVAEQEKGVAGALAQLIAVIAKHELASGSGR